MSEYTGDDVAIIWSNPTIEDVHTGKKWTNYSIERPVIYSGKDMLLYLSRNRWILGTPSNMLLNRDFLNIDSSAWINEISADLIMAVCATSNGKTVLLPDGNIKATQHNSQDGATQGYRLAILRAINTVDYLSKIDNKHINRYYACFSVVEAIGWLRNYIGIIKSGVNISLNDFVLLMKLFSLIPYRKSIFLYLDILKMINMKWAKLQIKL